MESLDTAFTRLLPKLRRYTRALVGDNQLGNYLYQHVYARLKSEDQPHASPAVQLYRSVSEIWRELGLRPVPRSDHHLPAEQRRVARMSPTNREAFLLMAMEGLNPQEASTVLGVSETEALQLMAAAIKEGGTSEGASIVIIEDEFFLARELAQIVTELGHKVVGRVRTRSAARECLAVTTPDLVLADIQLADESSGIDAVNDAFSQMGDVSVIFITAFPARLLCRNRPSPTFFIGKPFNKEQVMSAITLNLYFGSRCHFNDGGDEELAPPLVRFA
jgi:DNA-directed RNA polymerase specialized sigma24 family protein/CheY-like chemotaxis protein